MIGYVYRIIAPGSNSVYVGQSVNPVKRLRQHKSHHPHNPALAYFLSKHSDAEVYFWPVLDMDAEEAADEMACRGAGFNLLNCIPCGNRPPSPRGRKCLPETRAKRSAALKGRVFSAESIAKMGASHKGWTPSDETRLRMSEAHRGHTHSPETRAKISASKRRNKNA